MANSVRSMELSSLIARLEDEKDRIAKDISVAKLERAKDNCPYHVGQIIFSDSHRRDKRVRITSITGDGWSPEYYRLHGVVMKQDGTDGKREITIYFPNNWEREVQ